MARYVGIFDKVEKSNKEKFLKLFKYTYNRPILIMTKKTNYTVLYRIAQLEANINVESITFRC